MRVAIFKKNFVSIFAPYACLRVISHNLRKQTSNTRYNGNNYRVLERNSISFADTDNISFTSFLNKLYSGILVNSHKAPALKLFCAHRSLCSLTFLTMNLFQPPRSARTNQRNTPFVMSTDTTYGRKFYFAGRTKTFIRY